MKIAWKVSAALALAAATIAGGADAKAEGGAAAQDARDQFRITRVTPAYWRVTIDKPPFNIYGPDSMPQLDRVVTAIENDPERKVVVFDSAVPGFFLTHYDFVPPLEQTTSMAPGPTGLPPLPDMLVRLSKAGIPGLMSEECVAGSCAQQSFGESRQPVPSGVDFTAIYSRRDGIVDWRACVDPLARAVEVTAWTGLPHTGPLRTEY